MNKHCGLCKLIVRTLFQIPNFIEAARGGQAAEVRIAAREPAKVTWRPVEQENTEFTIADLDWRSGWCIEDDCMVRYVKRIDVSAGLNGCYWQRVIRASGQNAIDEKDRLLLVRSIPSDRVDVRRVKS